MLHTRAAYLAYSINVDVPTRERTGLQSALYNQPPLQTTPSEPQILQVYYNQPNQLSYNQQFPPLKTNQTIANQAQLPQLNQQSYHKVQPTYVFNPSTNQISSCIVRHCEAISLLWRQKEGIKIIEDKTQ
jgi:hypothetical protein